MKLFSEIKEKNILRLLFGALLISTFLPLRYVFELPWNYATGAYSDFTSFSIYSTDLLILGLVVFSLFFGVFRAKPTKIVISLVIWLIFVSVLNFKDQIPLNWYFLARILELLVLHETIRQKGLILKDIWVKFFVVLAALQSLLAVFQFISQKSLGLYLLGESHLDPNTIGIAKLGVGALKYIRAYGTFPHANLLSAFLLTAIFLNVYLLFKDLSKTQRILVSTNLGLTIFGLFLSFSRAAMVAGAVGLGIFFLVGIVKYGLHKKLIVPALIVFLSTIACVGILRPFLLARSDLLTDQSAKERIFYAQVGKEIIKDRPLAGVGIGTSVLHMEQYSPVPLESWEVQPIHNYYMLAGAELGIFGALILIVLFLLYVKQLAVLIKDRFSLYQLALLCIFISYLILMMFDHYFYTIAQTQILFWMILGFIAAEIYNVEQKTPQAGE